MKNLLLIVLAITVDILTMGCQRSTTAAVLPASANATEPWTPPVVPKVPSDQRVDDIRARFQKLSHPINYSYVVDHRGATFDLKGMDPTYGHLELHRGTRRLAEECTLTELIHALWPYLDGPDRCSDAYIMLNAKLNTRMQDEYHYVRGNIENLKKECRRALLQDDEWYPHKVLFDYEEVRAAWRDPVKRKQYIDGMQEALQDQKLRAENPLEVKNLLMLLSMLDAKEATSTFCEYMFYDWRTASDYRLGCEDDIKPIANNQVLRKSHNVYVAPVPCTTYLPRLGAGTITNVLGRLADCTKEELSVLPGGGAAPAFAVNYFIRLGYSEPKARAAITAYKLAHSDLSERQKAALDEIMEAITTKKYRTDALLDVTEPAKRTWAPSFDTEPWPNTIESRGFKFHLKCHQAIVLGYTGKDKNIVIPSEVSGIPVRIIAKYAFMQNTLTGIEIPESVTNIGEAAFCYCMQLTNLVLSSGLVNIEPHAFEQCRALKQVIIPETVSYIGYFAFSYCSERQWSIYFKGSPPTIHPDAFFSSSVTIYHDANKTNWPTTFGGNKTTVW